MKFSNVIWPDDLNDLTAAQQEELLVGIRERRSKIGQYVKNAKKVADKMSVGMVRNAIDKELMKFAKAFEKADKAIAEVEKRLNNVAALRLQLEDATQDGSAGTANPG